MAYYFCHVCRDKIKPIWELTRKGAEMGIDLKYASKDKGEKRQIPSSKYWKALNKKIWKPYCSPECSLIDHESLKSG